MINEEQDVEKKSGHPNEGIMRVNIHHEYSIERVWNEPKSENIFVFSVPFTTVNITVKWKTITKICINKIS